MRYLRKMEPLINAILNSDLPEVRRLITSDAKVISAKSESGRTPAQVAYSEGNYPMTAVILRNAPQCIDEIPTSPRELLEDLIGDFSQSTLCSGWNENIEFDLWALIINDLEYKRDYDRYLSADRESMSDIGWIASWAEGWFYWPNTEDSPTFIKMDDWEELYRKQRKR